MSARESERVLITIEDGIAIVTLNRPEKYNGLDTVSYTHLTLPTICSV